MQAQVPRPGRLRDIAAARLGLIKVVRS